MIISQESSNVNRSYVPCINSFNRALLYLIGRVENYMYYIDKYNSQPVIQIFLIGSFGKVILKLVKDTMSRAHSNAL